MINGKSSYIYKTFFFMEFKDIQMMKSVTFK